MDHQTITRNADGTLTSIDCPCGEDHGPSLREELDIMREGNLRAASKLNGLVKNLERVLELTEAKNLSGANRIKARASVSATVRELDLVATELYVMGI